MYRLMHWLSFCSEQFQGKNVKAIRTAQELQTRRAWGTPMTPNCAAFVARRNRHRTVLVIIPNKVSRNVLSWYVVTFPWKTFISASVKNRSLLKHVTYDQSGGARHFFWWSLQWLHWWTDTPVFLNLQVSFYNLWSLKFLT